MDVSDTGWGRIDVSDTRASDLDFIYQWTSIPTIGIKAKIDNFFDFPV